MTSDSGKRMTSGDRAVGVKPWHSSHWAILGSYLTALRLSSLVCKMGEEGNIIHQTRVVVRIAWDNTYKVLAQNMKSKSSISIINKNY